MSRAPQKCHSHERQGKTEALSQNEGDKCKVVLDLRLERGHEWEI